MKSALLITLLLTAGASIGMASPIFVDFASLNLTVQDITASSTPSGFTLDNVTFLYDNFGDPTTSAAVDSNGVEGLGGLGGLNGVLEFLFTAPTTGLVFNFHLDAPAVYADGAFVSLDNGFSNTIVTDANGDGTFSYISSFPTVNSAQIFFSAPVPTDFTVSSVTYNIVPEPGTLALTGSMLLLGVIGTRKLRRRS